MHKVRVLLLSFLIPAYAFAADPSTLADIGAPRTPGSLAPVSGGFNVTASGADIGGRTDQFSFVHQMVSGDFDVRVRVAALELADAFAKAGLMARDSLTPGSRFAAALATPSVSGIIFQSRATTNAIASASGAFPVNYPSTWLRLQRAGDVFTGYASYDGQLWSQLGSATIALSNSIYLGAAVCSHTTNAATATAEFRDYGDAIGATVGNPAATVEPLGPSSRKTGLVITEIMYKPAPRSDSNVLDFIEIYNSNPFFEDISGYRLSGDIDYTFPPNTVLQGGAFLVVAKDPADLQAIYGISNVHGPYTNDLPTEGTVRLRNQVGHIYLEIPYSNLPPWPVAADGTGHSLALLRPSYGEGQPQAWGISDLVGGSPGRIDTVRGNPLRNVVINEFLANTDAPLVDYVELYNHSNQEVDLSGCILTDDKDTNKLVIASGTRIPARGFISFDQSQLGFGLNSGGEKIYLWNSDRSRVLDALAFEPQASGISSGRFPDGAASIYPLRNQTPGAANGAILIRDIVINEIMYKPISADDDDEYVELYNKGTNAVDLAGWRFVAGITYNFPSNSVLAPNAYFVIAKNAARLTANHPGVLSPANTFGDFDGSLANKGERLALAMPDVAYTTNSQNQVTTNRVYVVVDEVTYGTGGSWGKWHNEGGSSLELIDPRADRRLAFNWGDSDETAKAPWTTIQYSGPMDNGADTANFFEVLALGEGEYLLDDAEVIVNGNNSLTPANSTFESGLGSWQSRGTHVRSTLSNSGGVGGSRCLHIRASARGDAIANRNLCPIPAVSLSANPVTLRAKVRWLRGWPELLLRLHGNYIEAVDKLQLPSNLGTPGARNSRARANNGPAIYQVSHHPVVPAAAEPVMVTARFHDVDPIASRLVKYRLDPAASYSSVPMNDTGVNGDAIAGDGLFSATIPGQPANTLVAFYVEAFDAGSPVAQSVFPLGAPQFEALVRFGDPVVSGGFGTYRQWFTASNVTAWINRPVLSNERILGTFVYGNFRAIYNIGSKYSGSPYHQGFPNPVTGGCHYSVDLPLDDILLGTENFNKIHAPGNGPFDDNTNQREQVAYWLARKMDLPWNYRRFINMFVNGNRRGGTTHLMEDTETPGNDVVESRWPDDPDGHLYKLQPWFEVGDGNGQSLGFGNQSWCLLVRFLSQGQYDKARYRWNYLVRAAKGTANDYTPVFELIDAANTPPSNPTAYFNAINSVANIEQWMRTFAVHHSVGDWDHFGSRNSQNTYGYVPQNGRWELMIWDFNIVLGNGSSAAGQNLFEVTPTDSVMPNLYNNPTSRRAYLRGLKELAGTHMAPASVQPLIDAKHNALLASGITPPENPQGVKTYIDSARSSILGQVATQDSPTFTVGATAITTNNNLVTITGSAPMEVATIYVNGVAWPVIWTSTRNFTIQIAVDSPTNTFAIQGRDVRGNPMPLATNTVRVNYTGPEVSPEGFVTISEIMYNPRVAEASYLELYNSHLTASFDLSEWRINGFDYTFPHGTVITNGQLLVVAQQRAAFMTGYGSATPIFAEADGVLDPDGETITLIKPGATEAEDVIIDQVRFESGLPWLETPPGTSLQVIDPAQDNSRPSNWSDGFGWKLFTYTANLAAGTNQLRFYMGAVGQIYIDDLKLVAGTVAEAGPNLIRNGEFEGPLLTSEGGEFEFSQPSLSNTVITTEVKRSGNSALKLVHVVQGPTSYMIQNGVVSAASGQHTISFWYLPITNNTTVTPYISSAYRPSANVRLVQSTPGAPNTSLAPMPAYPTLWLNEVQPNNISGIQDSSGAREPWLELYNGGTNTVNLSGLFLTDSYSSNLTQWAFPTGSSIAPGQFKVIFADGQPGQTTASEWHTSFRLPSSSGTLALTRIVNNDEPQIVDYLTYENIAANLSYGDYGDGQPFYRTTLYAVTPGSTNIARPGAVYINEWLAQNQNGLVDPADNDHDDWFELYNPNDYSVDLGGYYLTDNLTNETQFRIPDGYVVPAGGYLLVWADGETGQNDPSRADLHAGFALSRDGEAIGLFSSDGALVDSITFTNQTIDISEGRYPDGAVDRYSMTNTTPREPNLITGIGNNAAPVIAAITPKYVTVGQTVSFTATATDAEGHSVTWNLVAPPAGATIHSTSGLFAWTPNITQAPSTNNVTIRALDNGTPPMTATRSVTIYVVSPPDVVFTRNGSQVTLTFGAVAGQRYQAEYNDLLRETNWQSLGAPVTATGPSVTINDNVAAQPQRFYRIRLLD
jgi:regulation of enolase protein 1 (concanavalin A-like superfamily)